MLSTCCLCRSLPSFRKLGKNGRKIWVFQDWRYSVPIEKTQYIHCINSTLLIKGKVNTSTLHKAHFYSSILNKSFPNKPHLFLSGRQISSVANSLIKGECFSKKIKQQYVFLRALFSSKCDQITHHRPIYRKSNFGKIDSLEKKSGVNDINHAEKVKFGELLSKRINVEVMNKELFTSSRIPFQTFIYSQYPSFATLPLLKEIPVKRPSSLPAITNSFKNEKGNSNENNINEEKTAEFIPLTDFSKSEQFIDSSFLENPSNECVQESCSENVKNISETREIYYFDLFQEMFTIGVNQTKPILPSDKSDTKIMKRTRKVFPLFRKEIMVTYDPIAKYIALFKGKCSNEKKSGDNNLSLTGEEGNKISGEKPLSREELPCDNSRTPRSILNIINSIDKSGIIINKDFYITNRIMEKIKDSEKKEDKQKSLTKSSSAYTPKLFDDEDLLPSPRNRKQSRLGLFNRQHCKHFALKSYPGVEELSVLGKNKNKKKSETNTNNQTPSKLGPNDFDPNCRTVITQNSYPPSLVDSVAINLKNPIPSLSNTKPKSNRRGSHFKSGNENTSTEVATETNISFAKKGERAKVEIHEIQTFKDKRLPLTFTTDTQMEVQGSNEKLREAAEIVEVAKAKLVLNTVKSENSFKNDVEQAVKLTELFAFVKHKLLLGSAHDLKKIPVIVESSQKPPPPKQSELNLSTKMENPESSNNNLKKYLMKNEYQKNVERKGSKIETESGAQQKPEDVIEIYKVGKNELNKILDKSSKKKPHSHHIKASQTKKAGQRESKVTKPPFKKKEFNKFLKDKHLSFRNKSKREIIEIKPLNNLPEKNVTQPNIKDQITEQKMSETGLTMRDIKILENIKEAAAKDPKSQSRAHLKEIKTEIQTNNQKVKEKRNDRKTNKSPTSNLPKETKDNQSSVKLGKGIEKDDKVEKQKMFDLSQLNRKSQGVTYDIIKIAGDKEKEIPKEIKAKTEGHQELNKVYYKSEEKKKPSEEKKKETGLFEMKDVRVHEKQVLPTNFERKTIKSPSPSMVPKQKEGRREQKYILNKEGVIVLKSATVQEPPKKFSIAWDRKMNEQKSQQESKKNIPLHTTQANPKENLKKGSPIKIVAPEINQEKVEAVKKFSPKTDDNRIVQESQHAKYDSKEDLNKSARPSQSGDSKVTLPGASQEKVTQPAPSTPLKAKRVENLKKSDDTIPGSEVIREKVTQPSASTPHQAKATENLKKRDDTKGGIIQEKVTRPASSTPYQAKATENLKKSDDTKVPGPGVTLEKVTQPPPSTPLKAKRVENLKKSDDTKDPASGIILEKVTQPIPSTPLKAKRVENLKKSDDSKVPGSGGILEKVTQPVPSIPLKAKSVENFKKSDATKVPESEAMGEKVTQLGPSTPLKAKRVENIKKKEVVRKSSDEPQKVKNQYATSTWMSPPLLTPLPIPSDINSLSEIVSEDFNIDLDKLTKETKHTLDTQKLCRPTVSINKVTEFPLLNSFKNKYESPKEGIICIDCKRDPVLRQKLKKIPSVTRVLNATMADSSKIALARWRTNMISALGTEGFQEFYKGQIKSGSEFHQKVQKHFSGVYEDLANSSNPCLRSISTLSNEITDVSVIESHVIHEKLAYRGVIDCVAKYRNNPVIIEWKRSDKKRALIEKTFDAPLQLSAYLGALNYDNNYKLQVEGGVVIVAYSDGSPADVFTIPLEQCENYWKQWLDRLKQYLLLPKDVMG